MEQYRALATFRIIDRAPISVGQILTERSSQEPVTGSIIKPAARAMLKSLGQRLPRAMGKGRVANVTFTNTTVSYTHLTLPTIYSV